MRHRDNMHSTTTGFYHTHTHRYIHIVIYIESSINLIKTHPYIMCVAAWMINIKFYMNIKFNPGQPFKSGINSNLTTI